MSVTLSNFSKIKYKDLEELSIREEVDEFFTGEDFGQEKVNVFVIQKIRRDAEGNPKQCSCWNKLQNEGQAGCPSCGGMGYQFDEVLTNGYLANPENKRLIDSLNYKDTLGRSNEIFFIFYTNYKDQFFAFDIILRPVMNVEGFIHYPITYAEEYKITSNFNSRLDEDRLEYHSYPCQRTR